MLPTVTWLRWISGARRKIWRTAYRFMRTMAGDEAGFEEAIRALFAGSLDRLKDHIAAWPPDVREHALALAAAAMGRTDQRPGGSSPSK